MAKPRIVRLVMKFILASFQERWHLGLTTTLLALLRRPLMVLIFPKLKELADKRTGAIHDSRQSSVFIFGCWSGEDIGGDLIYANILESGAHLIG